MAYVTDARLVAAVDAAAGFGILGGGYGEEQWLVRELDLLDRSKARFGVGLSHGAWRSSRGSSILLWSADLRRSCFPSDPRRHSSTGLSAQTAIVICQVQSLQLRADRALHALLRMKRFPSDDTILNYFRRFTQAEIERFLAPVHRSACLAAKRLQSGSRLNNFFSAWHSTARSRQRLQSSTAGQAEPSSAVSSFGGS
jgi:hypothetical protein